MNRHWWEEHWIIVAILALYLSLGVAYSLVVPAYEAPDEPGHFAYVWYLTQYRRFSVQRPTYEENLSAEGHQPPLYYLLGAAATLPLANEMRDFRLPTPNPCFSWRPYDPGWQMAFLHTKAESFPLHGVWLGLHIVRWLSVLLGAITVWATYRLGCILFPARRWPGTAAAAIVAFNSQFIFIHSSANNDTLATTISALLLLAAVQAVTFPPSRRDFAVMGLLLGLGALTKYSTFALAPLPFLAIAWLEWKERDWRELLRRLSLTTAIPILVAGWWYVRNQMLYGDPLAWEIMLSTLGRYVARDGPFAIADLHEFIVVSFTSFWAEFGWLSLLLPPIVYVVLAAVCGLGLVGTLAELWQRRKARNPALWMVVVTVLVVCVSLLRYIQTINASGYQGRFLFPALPSLALLLALGLARLAGRRWARTVLAALGGALLLLAVTALWGFIRPAYAPPDLYEPATLPGLAQPCFRFDNQVELAAYQFEPLSIRLGETLQVTLYWHVLADQPQPPVLTVRLLGQGRHSLAEDAQSVQAWRHGDLFTTRHSLTVSDDVQPVQGLLAVQWHADNALSVSTARDRAVGDVAELGGFKIAPAVSAAAPQYPTAALFGKFAALRGYDLPVAETRPGEALGLTLHWEAVAPVDANYTVFVHLLDAEGRPVAQADGQPLGGAYPTTLWDAGERIADGRIILLGGDLPVGDYRLGVGWYLLETGQRLPATDAVGNHLPNDMAILETVHVSKGDSP